MQLLSSGSFAFEEVTWFLVGLNRFGKVFVGLSSVNAADLIAAAFWTFFEICYHDCLTKIGCLAFCRESPISSGSSDVHYSFFHPQTEVSSHSRSI